MHCVILYLFTAYVESVLKYIIQMSSANYAFNAKKYLPSSQA